MRKIVAGVINEKQPLRTDRERAGGGMPVDDGAQEGQPTGVYLWRVELKREEGPAEVGLIQAVLKIGGTGAFSKDLAFEKALVGGNSGGF